jgi:uncharacterized SAM-binding protein YcdF (DUF218 family)
MPKTKRALITIAALAGSVFLLLSALSYHIYSQGETDEATEADVIVVLGAAQWGGQPSPVLEARLDHALYLYGEGYAPALLLTGGIGEGESQSEAEAARNYVLRHSVSESVILMEQEGRTSLQSIMAAKEIMDQQGMSRAILVSDPFHMMRILKMAKDAGIEAYGSPTRTSPISKDKLGELRHILGESVLYVEYLLSKLLGQSV